MTAMPPLRPILNNTPASATDVDWNFQAVEDYVATDLIHRDGHHAARVIRVRLDRGRQVDVREDHAAEDGAQGVRVLGQQHDLDRGDALRGHASG